MKVTLQGNAGELEGIQPQVGDKAPQFSLENLYDTQISLEDLKGQKVLISTFPDIDTSVCEKQTIHFFKKASEYPDLKILNISNNTQAQLTKWCAVKEVESEMLSDKDLEFAKAFGLYVPKFDVLARSVFVIDEEGTVVFEEIVSEMTNEPSYDEIFAAVEKL